MLESRRIVWKRRGSFDTRCQCSDSAFVQEFHHAAVLAFLLGAIIVLGFRSHSTIFICTFMNDRDSDGLVIGLNFFNEEEVTSINL